jgi:hypothetical protein
MTLLSAAEKIANGFSPTSGNMMKKNLPARNPGGYTAGSSANETLNRSLESCSVDSRLVRKYSIDAFVAGSGLAHRSPESSRTSDSNWEKNSAY